MPFPKLTLKLSALLLAVCLLGGSAALAADVSDPVAQGLEPIPIGGPDYSPESIPTATPTPTLEAPEVPAAFLECAVIGADLTNAQTEEVYAIFGLRRGDVPELSLTYEDVRACLEGVVSGDLIGDAALESVYLRLLPAGSGIYVRTGDVSWYTEEVYRSALEAAGIADVEAVIAVPDAASGAAALAGIYKGYEDLTGYPLDAGAKQAGAEHMAAAADLAGQLEDADADSLLDALRGILAETGAMTDEELGAEIRRIAQEYNLTLNDGQVQMLVDLCRQLESLSESQLAERLQDLQDAAKKLGRLEEKAGETRETFGTALDKVKGFFGWVKDLVIGFFEED